MASPISEVPPSSRMVWGLPTASRTIAHHLEQLQASGHVGGEHAGGIDLAAHGNPFVDSRVHGVEGLGGGAGILGGVQPAAELQHPSVEFVEEFVQPALDREVHANVPAWYRKAQRRLVSRTEQFEHVEERIVTGLLDVDDDGLELVDGLGGHDELVLPEAR